MTKSAPATSGTAIPMSVKCGYDAADRAIWHATFSDGSTRRVSQSTALTYQRIIAAR